MAVSFVPLIILLVLVYVCARAVWVSVTLPRGVARVPACQACGYPVADLAGFTCPECGGDLREVGISTPAAAARTRGTLTGGVLGWTCLCLLVGYIGFTRLEMSGAFTRRVSQMTSTSVWRQSLTPRSGLYRAVEIELSTEHPDGARLVTLTFRLRDGSSLRITMRPGSGVLTRAGGRSTAWGPGGIEIALSEMGVPVGDAGVSSAEVEELCSLVDEMVTNPGAGHAAAPEHFDSGGTAMTSRTVSGFARNVAAEWATLGAMFVAYVLGLVWIVRRRRRLTRPASPVG